MSFTRNTILTQPKEDGVYLVKRYHHSNPVVEYSAFHNGFFRQPMPNPEQAYECRTGIVCIDVVCWKSRS